MKNLIIACVTLAVIAGLVYILSGLDVLKIEGLDTGDAPAGIAYIAGGCYIIGSQLIFWQKRGLWITGAVINALVVIFFYVMYAGNTDVLLSVPGLATKAAQVLLEIGLVTLIVKNR
ncbi:MAG: hypothetical protein MUO19_03625, partial [Dehalococcoidales bacterium]|nr:hypothetical protein [Dehalococcoidales bacterium]